MKHLYFFKSFAAIEKAGKLAILFIFFSLPALAQKKKFTGVANNDYLHQPALIQTFNSYKVFKIDASALRSFCRAADVTKFDLVMDEKTFSINLMKNDIRSADYRLIAGTDQGDVELPRGENITYMGFTDDGAQVRMTIANNFMVAYFVYKDASYYIEPLANFGTGLPADLFVFYKASDVIPDKDSKCGVIATENKIAELSSNGSLEAPSILSAPCLKIRYAVAADYLQYSNQFGSNTITAANSILALANNVSTYYATSFSRAINFTVTASYISTSATSSLETALTATTNVDALLDNFTSWAHGTNNTNGGFGIYHDIGSLWSGRDFDGSTIGYGSVGSVCTGSSYNIFQNLPSAIRTYVTAAHEIGHNFGASHDGEGNSCSSSGYIMAAVVGSTPSTTFSSCSVVYINAQISTYSCQTGAFALQGSPLARFFVSSTDCKNDVVLTDASSYSPTSWNWDMPGGMPASATTQNTTVSYSTTGSKTITLTAGNTVCDGLVTSSLSKTITVVDQVRPTPACTISHNNPGTSNAGANYGISGTGIYNVTFGTINNTTSGTFGDADAYQDFTCAQFTTITSANALLPINISITIGNSGTSSGERLLVYIDLNNDGIFQSGEQMLSRTNVTGVVTGTITLPPTVIKNTLIRMRVLDDTRFNLTGTTPAGYQFGPCSTPVLGQIEDYGLVVQGSVLPVTLLDFTAIAKDGKNLLSWQTATEINNRYFVVQRSRDGQLFTNIDTIPGHGTTSGMQSYSFIDNTPYDGLTYYRLRQTDYDGRQTDSKTISVRQWLNGGEPVRIYPTTAYSEIIMAYAQPVKTLQIINALGQVVKTIQPNNSGRQLSIDISGLSRGVYFFRVNQNQTIRFVKL